MNIFKYAKVIIAAATLVSSGAFAALTVDDSANGDTVASAAQGATAQVKIGGASARGNEIELDMTAAADIAVADTIVFRLPAGVNFVGAPTFKVTPETSGVGVSLKDSAGDPSLTSPAITLTDTNTDGLMDRASVVAATANLIAGGGGGDKISIQADITAGTGVTAGTITASVIVTGNLALTGSIGNATTSDVAFKVTNTAITEPQTAVTDVDVSGISTMITIPAGTAAGKTITLTPDSKVAWSNDAAGSTVTWTVSTPLATNPMTPTATFTAVAAQNSTATLTLTLAAATTVDTQVKLVISEANSGAQTTTGNKGVTVAGTAGVSGAITLFTVVANGSEAKYTDPSATVTVIVGGASAPQALPAITVTETYNLDLSVGGTFTITAPTGMKFVSAGTAAPAGGTLTGTLSVNAGSASITATVTHNGASETFSITGITAVVDAATTGALSVTVDTASASSLSYGPSSDVIAVANAVARGTVTATGPATASQNKIGLTSGKTATSTITLKETTYGSLTRQNAASTSSTANGVTTTTTTPAAFTLVPSTNATISAVAISAANYAGTSSPTISACVASASTADHSWSCEVTVESTAVVASTSTVSVAVTYASNSTAAVGDAVTLTIGGNVGITPAAFTVASVNIATKAALSGAITDADASATPVEIGSFTIKELFDGAVTAGKEFRIIAPAGLSFAASSAGTADASLSTQVISSTFAPNDTVMLTTVLTETLTITGLDVYIASGAAAGLNGFTIVDGNVSGAEKAGITASTINLVYVGLLPVLQAGSATDSVKTLYTVTRAVTGGLLPYTVATSAKTKATAIVSGSNVIISGVAAGAANITVTDALGATDLIAVTVTASAAQTTSTKLSANVGNASFAGGASKDGGATYATSFAAGTDTVTIVATVNIDPVDVGKAGEVVVVVLSVQGGVTSWSYMNADSTFSVWDGKIASLGAAIDAAAFGTVHNVTVHNGTLAAGTYRVAVGYYIDGGAIKYTTKATNITVQ
jgi:hypothetical protein